MRVKQNKDVKHIFDTRDKCTAYNIIVDMLKHDYKKRPSINEVVDRLSDLVLY